MTNREFYNAIANSENLSTELTEKAADLLAKLDAANAHAREKRAEKPSKKSVENAPIKAAMLEHFTEGTGLTAANVAALMDIKVQKASALLRQLVADNVLSVSDVKIKGKGTVKMYTAVVPETEVEAEG